MKLHSVLTAVVVVSSLSFAQAGLAEESSSFVARKAELAQRAADVAHERALANQTAPADKQQADTTRDS